MTIIKHLGGFSLGNFRTVLFISIFLFSFIFFQNRGLALQTSAIDPKTNCQINWVSSTYKIISVSWDGECLNGKAQGKSKISLILQDDKGIGYKGSGIAEFANGYINGNANMNFSDGESFNAEFKNGLMNGSGIYKLADGSVYEGNFKDNKQNGLGTYTWADGRIYKGEWKNGDIDRDLNGFLGFQWGAMPKDMKDIIKNRPNTNFINKWENTDQKVAVYSYYSNFSNKPANLYFSFFDNKFYAGGVLIDVNENDISQTFNDLKDSITQKYGPYNSATGKDFDLSYTWRFATESDYANGIHLSFYRKDPASLSKNQFPYAIRLDYLNGDLYNQYEKLAPKPTGDL
jgi:hypothetical protein